MTTHDPYGTNLENQSVATPLHAGSFLDLHYSEPVARTFRARRVFWIAQVAFQSYQGGPTDRTIRECY